MIYSDDYLRDHLPNEDPPAEAVPGEVHDEVSVWLDRLSESERDESGDLQLVARATRWTYAIFSELGLGRFRLENYRPDYWRDGFWRDGRLLLRDYRKVAFGLFDRETGEPGLGIIIDLPSWAGPSFLVVDHIDFPRLGGGRFPVALRQSQIDQHLNHPHNATTSCLAKCNKTSQWGFLTAGHAVSGSRPGRGVPMAGGGVNPLLRSSYQPVDAAFVTGTAPTPVPPKVPVLSFPAVGMTVDILCQSGATSRKVVQVTNNMGVLHTRSIGVYVYLDQPAKPGDSGALVQTKSGLAVGIYSGQMAVTGSPGGLCGLAQNFEQAIFALDVTPYR